jgi:hypothetical protein
MQHRREDKTTVFKDDVLCGVALCGAVGQVIDASWMLADGHSYAWGGPLLRLCLSLNALALVFRLADYYRYLYERKRGDHHPRSNSFLQVRRGFLGPDAPPALYASARDLSRHRVAPRSPTPSSPRAPLPACRRPACALASPSRQ